jgi:hypothetical protein
LGPLSYNASHAMSGGYSRLAALIQRLFGPHEESIHAY